MTNAEMVLALVSGTIKEIRISTNIPDISKKGQCLTYVMNTFLSTIQVSANDIAGYDDYTAEEAYQLLNALTSFEVKANVEIIRKGEDENQPETDKPDTEDAELVA